MLWLKVSYLKSLKKHSELLVNNLKNDQYLAEAY